MVAELRCVDTEEDNIHTLWIEIYDTIEISLYFEMDWGEMSTKEYFYLT